MHQGPIRPALKKPKGRRLLLLFSGIVIAVSMGAFVLRNGQSGVNTEKLFFLGFMGVATLVSVGTMALLYGRMRSRFAPGVEAMRQASWTATVTRRELKQVPVRAGHASSTHDMLVVYYRRDDTGQEENVMQYRGNTMDQMYAITPGLEYYREAPRFEVLESWQEGDKLEKQAGHYFPHKVA